MPSCIVHYSFKKVSLLNYCGEVSHRNAERFTAKSRLKSTVLLRSQKEKFFQIANQPLPRGLVTALGKIIASPKPIAGGHFDALLGEIVMNVEPKIVQSRPENT